MMVAVVDKLVVVVDKLVVVVDKFVVQLNVVVLLLFSVVLVVSLYSVIPSCVNWVGFVQTLQPVAKINESVSLSKK